MAKVVHVLGNGDKAGYYNEEERKGMLLLCNMPPFAVPSEKVYATCMVDFKMMAALTEGSLKLDMYNWVLGTRPRVWMEQQTGFYLKYAPNIKEFYTTVPKYAGNPTNFNCGHMAVHYACNKHKAEQVHLYGFDTLFDFNMRSITDLYLSSDRGNTNNFRLLNNWRPIWRDIFREFKNTEFILHHNHDELKIPKLDNVSVKVYNDPLSKVQKQKDTSDISDGRGMDQAHIPDPIKLNRKQKRMIESFARRGMNHLRNV